MIPERIKILNNELPDAPGVYFYYNEAGKLLYVGKATSLKKRVGSYFIGNDKHPRTAELVSKIVEIKYTQVPTVIEALVLEANQIRLHKPPYNILGRDDKSFIYLCITNEDFPKPVLMRGLDLERIGIQPFSKHLSIKARRQFLAVYGPYLSSRSLKLALDLIRRSIPWSTCNPPTPSDQTSPLSPSTPLRAGKGEKYPDVRPCFNAQIGKCPGVCSGAIDKKSYRRNIKKLMLFFEGKKDRLLKQLKREMAVMARKRNFEGAAKLRDRVFALEHIQDIGLLMRDEFTYEIPEPVVGHINALGRVEAYDIAHISGTSNVAAMVVFEGGKASKGEYRKFRIKGFEGTNDVGAMEEVMRRRLARVPTSQDQTPSLQKEGKYSERGSWPLPDIMIIDGGEGQVNRVEQVLREFKLDIPVVGIAKGFDRKQDRLVFDKSNPELRRVTSAFKEVFQKARDEAHRFAGAYHRTLRSRRSGIVLRPRPPLAPPY